MAQLARALSSYGLIKRPVLDRTALPGVFDFQIEFAPAFAQGSSDDVPPIPSGQTDSRPSLFTALQEQLGLKLESTKAPVDILVIDHIEKPTPD